MVVQGDSNRADDRVGSIYRSHQNSLRTWSKQNIFYDHALGFPRVDLGSNGGQIGVKQV